MSEELIELLANKKHDVKVENISMSIGELSSMYRDNELVLRPEYQRLLKWNPKQKTLLIESFLLGLPTPSVFVSADADGKWEIVDGLQRLSTIFDFMDGLKHEDTIHMPAYNPFRELTDDLVYLSGNETVSFIGKHFSDLPRKIQLEFKRQRVNVVALLSGTSEDVKYELFQRVNEGGTPITPMEFRRAILSYHNNDILSEINQIASEESFMDLFDDSFLDDNTFKAHNCILYFLTMFKNYNKLIQKDTKVSNVDLYITEYTRLMDPKITKNDLDMFRKVLNKINTLNIKPKKKIFTGNNKYSDTVFGAITLGIAINFTKLPNDINIKDKIVNITNEKDFKQCYKSGLSASARIPKMLDFAQQYFSK